MDHRLLHGAASVNGPGGRSLIRRLLGVAGAIRGVAASSSGALVAANAAATAMGVVSGVVTSRVLMPELRGDLAVLTIWPAMIAMVADVGISESTTVRIAREPAQAARTMGAGIALALVASALGVVVGYVALPYLLKDAQAHLLPAGRAYLAFIPVSLLSSVVIGGLLGLQRFRQVAALRVLVSLSYVVAALVLVALRISTPGAFATLTVLSTTAPLLAGGVPLWRRIRHLQRRPLGVGEHLGMGARLQGMRLAEKMAAVEDRPLASLALAQAEIGQYQIPSTLAVAGQTIALAKTQWLFSKLPSVGQREQADLVVAAYARACALTSLLAACCIPLLPVVIPLLYGTAFGPAVAPAIVVMLVAPLEAAGSVLRGAARSKLRVRDVSMAEVGSAAVMALAAVGLTRMDGLVGLAMAYGIGRLTSLTWMVFSARRTIGIEPRQLLPWSHAVVSSVRSDLAKLRTRARSAAEPAVDR